MFPFTYIQLDFSSHIVDATLKLTRPGFLIYYIQLRFSYFYLLVNANWGQWSPFTVCSTTCGEGQQQRIRLCNNPPAAHGGEDCILATGQKAKDQIEQKTCNVVACPSKKIYYLHMKKYEFLRFC